MCEIVKTKKSKIFQNIIAIFALLLLFSEAAYAAAGGNVSLGDIATNIMESFQNLGKLMLAIAYLSGFSFTISSIFKFKQHKDNPTQIPVSTPLALLIVGIMLIFLPGIIEPTGYTIFGTGTDLKGMAGGFKGGGAEHIPGADQ